jgi:predicted membrane protein
MEILAAVLPFVVSAIVGYLKQAPSFDMITEDRRFAVRAFAALIALVSAVLGMWITGNFDEGIITNLVNILATTFVAWAGSLGIFHGFFQKKQ